MWDLESDLGWQIKQWKQNLIHISHQSWNRSIFVLYLCMSWAAHSIAQRPAHNEDCGLSKWKSEETQRTTIELWWRSMGERKGVRRIGQSEAHVRKGYGHYWTRLRAKIHANPESSITQSGKAPGIRRPTLLSCTLEQVTVLWASAFPSPNEIRSRWLFPI